MNDTVRKPGIELLWLLGSLAFTLLVGYSLTGNSLFGGTVDIHLHDTMYVISAFDIWMPLFLIVTFLVYLIKESRFSFRRSLPNWILLITGIIGIVGLNFTLRTFSQMFIQYWVAYPPVSEKDGSGFDVDPIGAKLATGISIVQLLILLILLFVVYRWGTQRRMTPAN